EIKVYPNPVLDRLQIESKSELLSVSVCNITGHVVKQQQIDRGNTTEVNFEGLPAGIYLVRINSIDGMLTKKVLKN
ncbi:MAG: T9SS type A sorting domain-containing protein, partial [Bacteroidales bacterium]|nr:T9SS type A sorting domain-containing protein [Bacteroidales bacterium]